MNKSYVYLMKHESKPMVKIGKANVLEKRWNTLGNCFDFDSSYFKECDSEQHAFEIERRLHKAFAPFRLKLDEKFDGSTEWFNELVISAAIELVDGVQPVVKKIQPKDKKPYTRKIEKEEDHNVWPIEFMRIADGVKCKLEWKDGVIEVSGDSFHEDGDNLYSCVVRGSFGGFALFGGAKLCGDRMLLTPCCKSTDKIMACLVA